MKTSNPQKILLVDDNHENHVAIRSALEELGEDLVCVDSGKAALRRLLDEEFTLVLLDVNMPVMSGFEVAKMMGTVDRLRELPIIFLSATEHEEAQFDEGYALGGVDYIVTPLRPRILRAKVAALLRLHELTREERRHAAQMAESNRRLEAEIAERKRAEGEIRRLNQTLEARVAERTAKLTASNEELAGLSYTISHDLRAPLRAIDGYARILGDDCEDHLNEEGRRALGVVRREAQRMGLLIDALLTFSRLGRSTMESRSVDMKALAEDAFRDVCQAEPDRKVALQIGTLPDATGEPLMLRQVWTNLLANAVKFTGHCDKPRIEVGASRDNGDTVYFVRDNGAGFEMAHVGKLFGVFQRLHREEEFPGAGVGLAFVKRIVQRHGGRVWAEGALDHGASFYFALPNPSKKELTS